MEEVRRHGDFVFAAVKGDYGSAILPLYRYAVLIEVPKEIRLRRVRDRSFQKFGGRMKPGGDLYESEEAFFQTVAARPEDYAESWARTLPCPVVVVDGTRPVEENVERLAGLLRL